MVSSRLGGGVSPRGASSSPTPKKWNPPTCWVISLSSSGLGGALTGWGPMVSSITLSSSSSLSSASGRRACFLWGLSRLGAGFARAGWDAAAGRAAFEVPVRAAGAGRGSGLGSGFGLCSGSGAGALWTGGSSSRRGSGSAGSGFSGSSLAGSGFAGPAGTGWAVRAGAGAGVSGCCGSGGGVSAAGRSASSSRVRSSSEGRAASSRLPSAFSGAERSSMISPVGAMGVSAQKTSSSGSSGGGVPRAFSSLPKKRASRPCLRSGWREGLIISSGTWATLVVKKVSNFFCSFSSRVTSRRSASLGIHMSLPTRGSIRPGHVTRSRRAGPGSRRG